jgi:ZIP family zinc transporter
MGWWTTSSFALVALLYLVVEELLAEAHAEPDKPLATALFFAGFRGLLILDGLAGRPQGLIRNGRG